MLRDVQDDVTTSTSPSDDLSSHLSTFRDLALKVIYIIIGTVGVLDNLFGLIIFILFIKITEKVKTLFFLVVLFYDILIIFEVIRAHALHKCTILEQ